MMNNVATRKPWFSTEIIPSASFTFVRVTAGVKLLTAVTKGLRGIVAIPANHGKSPSNRDIACGR